MRNSFASHPPLAAVAFFAAASAAQSQDCLWTYNAGYPLYGGAAVYHSGLQRILFLATSAAGQPINIRIYAWDGAAWTLIDSGPAAPIANGSVAYDSARDRIVVFGGYLAGASVGDTWEWDRTTWTEAASSGPPARFGNGMAYDEARHRTVIFGGAVGLGSTGLLGDTWEWDGHSWTLAATTGPSARLGGAMAYDSSRARTVQYSQTQSNWRGEVWEWDGVIWRQQLAAYAVGAPAWMAFDPARSRLIASLADGGGTPQTWEADTATYVWSLRDVGIAPRSPAAFDIARSRLVAIEQSEQPGRTMEYDGAATLSPAVILFPPTPQDVTRGSAAHFTVSASGTAITYQWFRSGQPLANGGNISGADTDTLTIDPTANSDVGQYTVVVSNVCATVASRAASLILESVCYANCDDSTTPPQLNVNDFVCFLNRFAAGDPWANCDGPGCDPPPCLNVLDFGCFLNRFAAGCSAF